MNKRSKNLQNEKDTDDKNEAKKDPYAEITNTIAEMGLFGAIVVIVFIPVFIALIPLIGAGIGFSLMFGDNEPKRRR